MSGKPPRRTRRVAFVTGASRGIGRSIAIELAKSGCDVAGGATRFDPADPSRGLAEVQAAVEALGAAFLPVPGDLADLSQHERMVAAVLDRFGRIDVLVNNAGIAPSERRDVLVTTPESFDRVLAVNARGTFFLTQRVARHMVEARQPERRQAIVFITSISADASSTARVEYCMSKAAAGMAAKVFAHRLAGDGIAVFDVRPGIIETDMVAPVLDRYREHIKGGLVPQGRMGRPEDVGRVVAALARDEFTYATGAVIEVSGGMNIRRV